MSAHMEKYVPYVVVIFDNGIPIQHYVVIIHSDQEMEASVGGVEDGEVRSLSREILERAVKVADFYKYKPSLREMIQSRINEIKDHDDRKAGSSYSPAEVDDLPF